jgi:formylglycine-generating enzyme required for sulfatase activity
MLRAAVILFLIAVLPSPLRAEARIALLIGNEAYGNEIGRLANPHNDVALLEGVLKGLGFDVATVRDAGLGTLHHAVNAYGRRLQAAGPNAVGFFYYSGHGASDGSTNYLIPVDVKTTETGELWDQSLRLAEVTRKLKSEAGNATHFVVFDACRNTLKLTQRGSRAVVQSKGFVPVAQENGMLIAYATAEGELASDVGAGAGPYAKVLAEEIVKPGIEAVVMFRTVQRRLRASIRQEPYLGFNALGDVYFAGPPSVVPPAPQVVLATPPTRQPPPELPTPSRCDGIEIAVGKNERRCFKPGAGKTEYFKDCPTCPEMVVVPAGSFTMGSPPDEPGRLDDENQVGVSIEKPFAVGRFAVTFGEWDACVAEGGCHGFKPKDQGWGRGKHPVINVNWDDAKIYVAWVSRKTDKTYRLLSEAEREYVARAGTTTPFWWGSSITPKQANYDGSADPYKGGGSKGENRQRTVPVDSFEPNPWGLYNVHGNVWEWTEDCWNERNIGNPGDGRARTTGDCSKRVNRGGSWYFYPQYLRSANRIGEGAGNGVYFWVVEGEHVDPLHHHGFRLARSL